MPWFSGLCLEGEVAGQYEMDLASSPQEPEGTGVAGVLALDGLAPITIFVGANNSGKSRLMRELFKTQQPLKIKLKTSVSVGTEVDIGKELAGWINDIRGHGDNALAKGWIVEAERDSYNAYLSLLDGRISDAQRKGLSSLSEKLETLKQRISECGIKLNIPGIFQFKRCYIPMIRGMRPPLKPELAGQVKADDRDWYKLRTKIDHFANYKDLRKANGYGDQQIFTGLGLYGDLRERLLARTKTVRDSVRDYESFLSKHFFPG